VLNKVRLTNLEHHGVEWSLQNVEVRRKGVETLLSRYGVTNPSQLERTKIASHSPASRAKRHATMKANCTYGKSSKPEEKLYTLLCAWFDVDNVSRNVFVNSRWPIDFYIKSIDTYVQLDGIYWHGLDRPIEVIAEHRTKRDAQIHKKWLTDREQNRWFSEREMNLVRVTDAQFNLLIT
jgi:hypothetical protein